MRKKELLEYLYNEIFKIIKDNKIEKFLDFVLSFSQYSFRNKALIYVANPDATFVAGMRTWNKFGYRIKKGEKAIKIFAPVKEKITEEDENGEKHDSYKIKGFCIVPVFDKSQTVLVEPEKAKDLHFWTPAKGAAPEYETIKDIIAQKYDVDIGEDRIATVLDPTLRGYSKKGEYNSKYEIAIESTLPEREKLSVLFHETGHIAAGHVDEEPAKIKERRPEKEIVAETISALMMDTIGYGIPQGSIDYISVYAKDIIKEHGEEKGKKIITESFDTAYRTAGKIKNSILERQPAVSAAA